MGFSNQVIRVFLQSFYASTILATVCSLPTKMTTSPSTSLTFTLPPTTKPSTVWPTVRPPTLPPTDTSSPTLSPTVRLLLTTTPFTREDALIRDTITELTLPGRSVSALGNAANQDRTKSDESNSKAKSESAEEKDGDDEQEEIIQVCEMPEDRDPLKRPPKTALYQSQIDKIVAVREELKQLKNNRTLLNLHSDLPIVNLTTDQINQFLPFYRGFFRVPAGEELSQGDGQLRNRRDIPFRICPALGQQTYPQLGINAQGTISQIIQLNSMNINQVFFEEECEFSTSPLDPSIDCIESTRLVTALVIDLNEYTTDVQDIEIQSCVGVKYL